MGDLPGWIQTAIAVVSLFVGPGVGVYRGGVARTRLEDRRRLLDEWPRLLGYFLFGRSHERMSEKSSIQHVNSIVRRLPYKDRAMWMRVLRQYSVAMARKEAEAADGAMVTKIPEYRLPSPKVVETVRHFEFHLLRHANPTLDSRVRNLFTSFDLLRRGPRRWDVDVSPTSLTYVRQNVWRPEDERSA